MAFGRAEIIDFVIGYLQEFVQSHIICDYCPPPYCKRGYFAGGKFRENVGKTFHMGVIFTILLFPS